MPWPFLAAPVVLVCISGWLLFRLYSDESIRGKNLDSGRFLAMAPAVIAAGLIFWMIGEYSEVKEASQAVREHRCVWREGVISHHSHPGELAHGSMSFTIGRETYFYSDMGSGFGGPMCVPGAPCDGDYVRVCRYKAAIFAIQKRTMP